LQNLEVGRHSVAKAAVYIRNEEATRAFKVGGATLSSCLAGVGWLLTAVRSNIRRT
jgi:hypothetical protein